MGALTPSVQGPPLPAMEPLRFEESLARINVLVKNVAFVCNCTCTCGCKCGGALLGEFPEPWTEGCTCWQFTENCTCRNKPVVYKTFPGLTLDFPMDLPVYNGLMVSPANHPAWEAGVLQDAVAACKGRLNRDPRSPVRPCPVAKWIRDLLRAVSNWRSER